MNALHIVVLVCGFGKKIVKAAKKALPQGFAADYDITVTDNVSGESFDLAGTLSKGESVPTTQVNRIDWMGLSVYLLSKVNEGTRASVIREAFESMGQVDEEMTKRVKEDAKDAIDDLKGITDIIREGAVEVTPNAATKKAADEGSCKVA